MFKRNLIYFICPFKSNNEWRLNVRELVKYMDAFNNRKIVTVAQGPGLIGLEKIKQEFKDKDIQYITISNERKTGEVKPFKNMMKKVFSLDHCEATFYAHAKGVSPKYENRTNRHFMGNIRVWRNTMYHYCLRDPNSIERILSDFSCCGPYICREPVGGIACNWFFAGTYFWFNNSRIFSNNNWDIESSNRHAVEAYLGLRVPFEEAYCLSANHPANTTIPRLSQDQWKTILPDFLTAKDFEYGFNSI